MGVGVRGARKFDSRLATHAWWTWEGGGLAERQICGCGRDTLAPAPDGIMNTSLGREIGTCLSEGALCRGQEGGNIYRRVTAQNYESSPLKSIFPKFFFLNVYFPKYQFSTNCFPKIQFF